MEETTKFPSSHIRKNRKEMGKRYLAGAYPSAEKLLPAFLLNLLPTAAVNASAREAMRNGEKLSVKEIPYISVELSDVK